MTSLGCQQDYIQNQLKPMGMKIHASIYLSKFHNSGRPSLNLEYVFWLYVDSSYGSLPVCSYFLLIGISIPVLQQFFVNIQNNSISIQQRPKISSSLGALNLHP